MQNNNNLPPMTQTKSQAEIEKKLIKEIKELSKEVRRIKDMEYVKILKHPFKLMWLSLLKGMMVGFGSVLGASVLVAVAIYLVAQISFVPIIGDFVEEIMSQIQMVAPSNNKNAQESDFVNQYNETKQNIEQQENMR